MLVARHLMDPRIETVRWDEPLARCARRFGPHPHLVVVDDAGDLVGLLNRDDVREADGRLLAGDLAQMVPTVRPDSSLTRALDRVWRAGAEGVIVTSEPNLPDGAIWTAHVVQIARFVVPASQRVGDLMDPEHPNRQPLQGPRLHVDDEARVGAEALVASKGGPVSVLDDRRAPVGIFAPRHAVRAVLRVLGSPESMLFDPIP